jgi:hypothetical protein
MATATIMSDDILDVIEAEYAEMPGMRLTEAQFRRLWDLTPEECHDITTTLMARGILTNDTAGRYCRCTDIAE